MDETLHECGDPATNTEEIAEPEAIPAIKLTFKFCHVIDVGWDRTKGLAISYTRLGANARCNEASFGRTE